MTLIKFIKYRNIASLLQIFATIVVAIQIIYYLIQAHINYFSITSNIFMGFADALLIMLPFVWLIGKWRLLILTPLTMIPISLHINILYYRNFQDLLPLSGVFRGSNFTSEVWESGIASILPSDTVIWVPYFVFLLVFFPLRRQFVSQRTTIKFRLAFTILCFVFAITEELFLVKAAREGQPDITHTGETRIIDPVLNDFAQGHTNATYLSVPQYWMLDLVCSIKKTYKYNDSELRSISEFLNLHQRPIGNLNVNLPDNSHMNLILIIVESLNSSLLEQKINGYPVYTFLDSIINSDSVVYFPNLIPQIGQGRSSDAAFMYLTGLLPVPDRPMAVYHPDVNYPSIPRICGIKSIEFNAASPNCWNNHRLNKSYGYNSLVNISEKHSNTGPAIDSILFAVVADSLQKLQQPFLCSVFTMGMHDPYDKYNGERSFITNSGQYKSTEENYMEATLEFEKGLKSFIHKLKQSGIYDKSVIFIISDHTARESLLLSPRLSKRNIPLIALNTGLAIKSSYPIGQIDIFPSILDIMGYKANWYGIGTSILRNPGIYSDSHNASDSVDWYSYPSSYDWEMSSHIIEGEYFNHR